MYFFLILFALHVMQLSKRIEIKLTENRLQNYKIILTNRLLLLIWSWLFFGNPLSPTMWPHPTPGVRDLNKLDFTLPQDASMHLSAFLAKWLWKDYFKGFCLFIHKPILTQVVAQSIPCGPTLSLGSLNWTNLHLDC